MKPKFKVGGPNDEQVIDADGRVMAQCNSTIDAVAIRDALNDGAEAITILRESHKQWDDTAREVFCIECGKPTGNNKRCENELCRLARLLKRREKAGQ